MTEYGTRIENAAGDNPAFGDHIEIVRTITGLATAQTITKAWLTVKASPSDADVDALLQIDTDGADGDIGDDGTGDTDGEVTFTISGSAYDDLAAETSYHYDIQTLLDDGTLTTLEVGRVRWNRDVTQTTS